MATYAVFHGAGDVGASWDLVAEQLRARGHAVVAPDLPCEDADAGLDAYVDTVVAAVGDADDDADDVVVVAHSLGGFMAPQAAQRLGARLLVLVTAMVPLPGETAGEWWETSGYMAATAGGPPLDEAAQFLHDVPPDLAAAALAAGRDQSGTPMREPWPLDAWPQIPTRFLICRDDRFFPADWMRGVVRERLGIEPDEIDGSHGVYLSRPAELARRLEDYRAELG